MSVVTGVLHNAKSEYGSRGWYQSPELLSAEAVAKLRNSVDRISAQQRPEVVYERGTRTVRAIHGCHEFDEVCARLVRLPQLVDLAETLVGEQVYIYQFKVNLKQPHEGAAWPSHQDYAFWSREDGMPSDNAVNIAIFLDDVHEGNGPLKVIPGSHRLGLIDSGDAPGSEPGGDWRRHVSVDLGHTVPEHRAAALELEHGQRLAIGPAGTICAFHSSIVHSSSNNLSADRRALLLITYNAVTNAPANPSRPGFLVGRDTTPVVRLDEREL